METLPLLTLPTHNVFTGSVRDAWATAKANGVPVQQLMPDGRVVIRWFEDGKRRQETRPANRVRILFDDVVSYRAGISFRDRYPVAR